MANKFNDETLINLDYIYVVRTIVGEETFIDDDGDEVGFDILEYNIAVVSPKKPRKAYYVCNETITTNAVTKEDEQEELDKIDYGDDVDGAYYDYVLAKTRIDGYEAKTLREFISSHWFIDNLIAKSNIVKKIIGNREKVSIKELKSFEKLFNDKNFRTEEQKKEEQKQKDDKCLDEMFR